MKVIGLDPGLANTGFGIVEGSSSHIKGYRFGTIRTKNDTPIAGRLHHIYKELLILFDAEKPDLIIVEDIFSLGRYPRSAIILGKISGIILLAGYHQDVSIVELPSRKVKQILTGNGNADKHQVERAIRHLLVRDGPIVPSHASDALGLALIGLFRYDHVMHQ
nr:crossover junction endodeoxyribonuclease [Desulfobacterales bacterium]